MSEITIRKGLFSDAESIAEIERDSFSCPWSQKAVEDFLSFEANAFFCAFIGSELCGYASISFVLDEAEIANVAVKNSFRRRGIGKKLMDEVLFFCRKNGISKLSLEVRESNSPAIGLYEKCGFTNVGLRRRFYTKPTENAVIMAYSF